MVAVPVPTAVTLPLKSTVATSVLLEEKLTVADGLLDAGENCHCKVSESPMLKLSDVWYNDIETLLHVMY